MELEGLKRCKKSMDERNLKVSELTTDRHTSVVKYLAQKWGEVRHFFDTWHIAKSK